MARMEREKGNGHAGETEGVRSQVLRLEGAFEVPGPMLAGHSDRKRDSIRLRSEG